MAVTITWGTTAPTVDEWVELNDEHDTTLYTPAYEYDVSGKGHWFSRVGYSIGRITGTRDFAVRAVCRGRKASGAADAEVGATPEITVGGVTETGSKRSKTATSASYTNIGTTQYAVVSGASNKAEITCVNTRDRTKTLTLYSPISAPEVFVNIGDAVREADAVYINVNGTIMEADSVYMNVNGTIVEA